MNESYWKKERDKEKEREEQDWPKNKENEVKNMNETDKEEAGDIEKMSECREKREKKRGREIEVIKKEIRECKKGW